MGWRSVVAGGLSVVGVVSLERWRTCWWLGGECDHGFAAVSQVLGDRDAAEDVEVWSVESESLDSLQAARKRCTMVWVFSMGVSGVGGSGDGGIAQSRREVGGIEDPMEVVSVALVDSASWSEDWDDEGSCLTEQCRKWQEACL